MKYRLINIETKEEHLCDKVTVDIFDYYFSDEIENKSGKIAYINNGIYKNELRIVTAAFGNDNLKDCKKVIATNNSNIDIPKVVDDVEELCKFNVEKIYSKYIPKDLLDDYIVLYKLGYNKCKEEFGNSDQDMIEFVEWIDKNRFSIITINDEWTSELLEYSGCFYSTKELIKIWKEQKLKIVYYE